MERKEITKIVLVALFAALIAAGAFIKIPLVPVPVTLTTLFVLLAALCLPPLMALSSIVVYLFLGGIGLPIFTSGGGLAAMLGPTGGYLFGMIPAALFGSLIMRLFESKLRIGAVISSIVSTVFIYLVGLPCRTSMACIADGSFCRCSSCGRLCTFHSRRCAQDYCCLHYSSCYQAKNKRDA